LKHLEELAIVGGVFAKQSVLSFEPIARLGKKLKVLDLSGVKLKNPDLSPLSRLPEPDEFGISARFYPLEQIAILAAAFPKWGDQLMQLNDNPYNSCKKCGEPKKILFKYRSRDLCPNCDQTKITKFLTAFQVMVEGYKKQM
jgi:hypothetical protein